MARSRDEDFAEEPLPPEDEGKGSPRRRRYEDDDKPAKKSNTTMIVVLSIVGVVLVGCGGCAGVLFLFVIPKIEEAKNRTVRTNDMRQLNIAYLNFQSKHQRGPANLAELEAFDPMPSEGYKLVREGKVEVVWNVNIARQVQGSSNVMLLYETKADPDGQRVVVMADGSARRVTEAEFNGIPKADPTPAGK